ncbi:MAG TPA: hypothetical protein VG317_09310 [Pseudonocardiaceae bacterium]|nr:hypothetical protein [Pseudonocardiaceae bacterium]
MLVIGLVSLGTPALADPPELQVTLSSDTINPGQTVTITVTFTNIQATPVQFVYESLSPDYYTQMTTAIYTFQSCTGDDTWCDMDSHQNTVGQETVGRSGLDTS